MTTVTTLFCDRKVEVEVTPEVAESFRREAVAQEALKRTGGYITSPMGFRLWLEPCGMGAEDAAEAFDEGDPLYRCYASNEVALRLVWMNRDALLQRGFYEASLLDAFTASRVNNHNTPMSVLRILFLFADRKKLRAAGDPLPGAGPFTLYRGVSGKGSARRIRGYSWTADFDKAKWFACRYTGLSSPAVMRSVVPTRHVYAYSIDRNEQEFIVDPACFDRPGSRPVKVWQGEEVDTDVASGA